MTNLPRLSVVIPAFNEEACLAATVQAVVAQLDSMHIPWEVVVVNDGSTDRTALIAEEWARRDPRVRALTIAHAGKGAAVREGMLAARGDWRFLADADLSMPIAHLSRFFAAGGAAPETPIVIGSREAPGSRRLDEPFSRHAIGRAFNVAVRLLLVPGINDTQCGFKLFSRDAANALFAHQRLNGFGFDVEILALARVMGFRVQEVPIDWRWAPNSKVTLRSGASGFLDLFRIRWNLLRGAYATGVPRETGAELASQNGVDG